MKQYWDADSGNIIKLKLNELTYSFQPLIFWQNQKYRRKWNLEIDQINLAKGILICAIKPIEHIEEPNIGQIAYIADVNDQSIFFKCTVLKYKRKKVALKFPELIKCVDSRKTPRSPFSFKQNKRCTLSVDNVYGTTTKDYSTRVLDISKSGAAVCFGAQMLTKLKVGTVVTIKNINHQDIKFIDAYIKYIREVSIPEGQGLIKQYRCGIEFSKELDEETITSILMTNIN